LRFISLLLKDVGPIVRISPNELHVSDPDFYEEIYAGGNRRRDKYIWQTSSGNSAQAMGFTVDHWHHRERREPINPHFSKRNVSRLESLIRLKVEQLCERLEEYSASRQPVNLTVCYLAFTMDVITTYSFGKSSNLLENELNTRWKDTITSIMKSTSVLNHFSWIPKVMDLLPEYLISGFMDMAVLIKLKMVRLCSLGAS
jgi:cytochrome P450